MIGEKLEDFISAVMTSKKEYTREDYIEACDQSIKMACDLLKEIRDSEQRVSVFYERLERFVSDSLPWSDNVLKTWDLFKRVYLKEKANYLKCKN